MKKIFVLMSVSMLFSGIFISCRKDNQVKEEIPKFNDRSFNIGGVEFKMIAVKGGSFMMGAQTDDMNSTNYDESATLAEAPVHKVTLSDYYIGEFEVTQALWMAVMTKDNKDYKNPSSFGKYPDKAEDGKLPVDKVSWKDISMDNGFLDKLNSLLKDQLPEGKKFRLPTEAEWEYAARGGSKHDKANKWRFSGGEMHTEVGWVSDNSKDGDSFPVHAVGTKKANELGIYDMTGNVWEWCSDWYNEDYYKQETSFINPKGPESSNDEHKVLRGGSAKSSLVDCRVSLRNHSFYGNGAQYGGFRIAL